MSLWSYCRWKINVKFYQVLWQESYLREIARIRKLSRNIFPKLPQADISLLRRNQFCFETLFSKNMWTWIPPFLWLIEPCFSSYYTEVDWQIVVSFVLLASSNTGSTLKVLQCLEVFPITRRLAVFWHSFTKSHQ